MAELLDARRSAAALLTRDKGVNAVAQPPPIIPLVAKQARLQRLTNGQTPKVVLADTTNASPNLTNMGNVSGVAIGATVTGAGIPAATTIIAIDDAANTGVLSANATATAAGVSLTFTNPANPGPLKFRLGQVNTSMDDAATVALLAAGEATFDGYPAGGTTLSYTAGYITPERIPSNESQMIQYIMATAVVTNTVYYWWIDDGTTVWMCANFTPPPVMGRVGAALKVMVEDSYPPGIPLVVVLP